MASKIAAHAADIAGGGGGGGGGGAGGGGEGERGGWGGGGGGGGLDPETAKSIRRPRPEHDDSCSMCGKFCAVRSMNKALNGEHIDIL